MLTLAFLSGNASSDEPLRFNRDIRPILSDKCFLCHGFDASHREAGLRLDQRASATQKLESGTTAIVPNQAEMSMMIKRIISNDPDEVMPPPSSKLGKLTSKEVETLKHWINEGAPYEGSLGVRANRYQITEAIE